MKTSPFETCLLAVLALSAVLSAISCYAYVGNTRTLRSLQTNLNIITQKNKALEGLAGEALEYSKRNPSIDPILEWAKLKRKTSETSTNPVKPAGK